MQIPLTLIKTEDFTDIYEAIHATKRKIPAKVLRYCKEQLYELVQSNEPEKKICVVDIDEIETKEDVEFLVGVGVANQELKSPSQIGYESVNATDLIDDLLFENKSYNGEQILKHVASTACKSTPNIPVFMYLNRMGIDSQDKYIQSGFSLDKVVNRDLRDFRANSYTKPFFRKYRHMSMQEIIDSCTPENASAYIPFLSVDKIELDLLLNFLTDNREKMDYSVSNYASNYRKLAALYDKLKWGW